MCVIHRNIRTATTRTALLVMLTLASACGLLPPVATPPPVPNAVVLATSAPELNDQSVVAVTMTPVDTTAENQAAATAQIVRANAQATLDLANSTVSAAQTQDQNNADAIAAQIAATAKVARSQAQATLVAAGSTQSVGLTQVAIQQTQEEYNFQVTLAAGTQSVVALMTQQNQNRCCRQYADGCALIISPRKPKWLLQHHSGSQIRRVRAKSRARFQSPSFGCGAYHCSLCCWQV